MSIKLEIFQAIMLDELMVRMGLADLGWHKGIVSAHLMRNHLTPYIFRGWENEESQVCKAEPIKPALLKSINCNWLGPRGQKVIPARGGGEYVSVSFSFSGLEFDSTVIVFKQSDVESFLSSTTLGSVLSEIDGIRGELRHAISLVKNLEEENRRLRATCNSSKSTNLGEGRNQHTAETWQGHMTIAVKMAFEMASKN